MSTEPNLVMIKEADGAVYARPGLGETLKRVETEFYVFLGDDPDRATVGVFADGIDDAAGLLAAMPGASIAVRELYAGEWAVHRTVMRETPDVPHTVIADDPCPKTNFYGVPCIFPEHSDAQECRFRTATPERDART